MFRCAAPAKRVRLVYFLLSPYIFYRLGARYRKTQQRAADEIINPHEYKTNNGVFFLLFLLIGSKATALLAK